MISIWWIRKDLRIADNPALVEGLRDSEALIPVYIIDPILLRLTSTNIKKMKFFFSSLNSLDTDLRTLGSKLIVRMGNPEQELRILVNETGANKIYALSDYSRYSLVRDYEISQILPLQLVDCTSYIFPGNILKSDGTPYTIFTPFKNAWKNIASKPVPKLAPSSIPFPKLIEPLFSLSIPESFPVFIEENPEFLSGELGGNKRLVHFAANNNDVSPSIYSYSSSRDRLDLDGTSKLSPYLRFGILSSKQVLFSAYEAIEEAYDLSQKNNAEIWLNELIWREFYLYIQFHFPQTMKENFRRIKINWINSENDFYHWNKGLTGYPIVDSGIRQLITTGWMHNRARMITASFLTKDLLIDWKLGEKFFMDYLIDGDPALNNGGWQWVAGTGTDAAPYFRIFNPTLQGVKYDPHGNYIRRWVPELSLIPDRFIHEPWLMNIEDQKKYNCVIGYDYPSPIIDHKIARERALKAYGNP